MERDLGAQLEAALRACVIGARWPKSGAEVIVTVLEAAEECVDVGGKEEGVQAPARAAWTREALGEGPYARMVVLAGCISVAGAALAVAGIDGVDLVSGGVAALVRAPATPSSSGLPKTSEDDDDYHVLLDPDFAEHPPSTILAACSLAYLRSRDEIAGLWTVGEIPLGLRKQRPLAGIESQSHAQSEAWERLIDAAVRAAALSGQVVRAAVVGE